MRKWLIKINGKYLKGYNDTQTHGKTGHMGWQPRDTEMPAIVLTDSEDEAYVVEGTINLRGQIDRIMDRVRFAGLDLSTLEILKAGDAE